MERDLYPAICRAQGVARKFLGESVSMSGRQSQKCERLATEIAEAMEGHAAEAVEAEHARWVDGLEDMAYSACDDDHHAGWNEAVETALRDLRTKANKDSR